ncbi:hypothetical protein GF359_07410 [candidate division WOR-3 bacterium]|uniref:Cell division protein FtsL n=1 Tax=candidate division WOR-3 bacterium TaxID=2052148 RepID=A0A9D5KA17_UNCW3|nr:hypothetical protein [candidate division WOR-3 bacterium]MBD3365027.1 hypothetical protein [candidate division WOR-3 bacterium]
MKVMKGVRKIVWVVLAVALMLSYVWMRMVHNKVAEHVVELRQETEILVARLEREKMELNKELLATRLEDKAKAMGLYYPWEDHGSD